MEKRDLAEWRRLVKLATHRPDGARDYLGLTVEARLVAAVDAELASLREQAASLGMQLGACREMLGEAMHELGESGRILGGEDNERPTLDLAAEARLALDLNEATQRELGRQLTIANELAASLTDRGQELQDALAAERERAGRAAEALLAVVGLVAPQQDVTSYSVRFEEVPGLVKAALAAEREQVRGTREVISTVLHAIDVPSGQIPDLGWAIAFLRAALAGSPAPEPAGQPTDELARLRAIEQAARDWAARWTELQVAYDAPESDSWAAVVSAAHAARDRAEDALRDVLAASPAETAQAEGCCAICGKLASQSEHFIAGEYPEEGEWFCSVECQRQYAKLDESPRTAWQCDNCGRWVSPTESSHTCVQTRAASPASYPPGRDPSASATLARVSAICDEATHEALAELEDDEPFEAGQEATS